MSNATKHDELVTVATFPEPIEAAVARSALEAAGIEVYLRGETANSMVPVAFTAQLQGGPRMSRLRANCWTRRTIFRVLPRI